MTTLYGISNCDTVNKARKWLDDAGVDYRFHDFRKDGVTEETISAWIDALGWDSVVNRRSATWRELDASIREGMDAGSAVNEILTAPTLVKRPVLEHGNVVRVGFSVAAYEELFA